MKKWNVGLIAVLILSVGCGCATIQKAKDYIKGINIGSKTNAPIVEAPIVVTNVVPPVVEKPFVAPVPKAGWTPTYIAKPTNYIAPRIVVVYAEDKLPTGPGRLPTIAVDSTNQPHIVYDVDRTGNIMRYDRINGIWQLKTYTSGGNQFYNPHIEINEFDEAFISGIMWFPQGMGIIYDALVKTLPGTTAFVYNKGGFSGLPCGSLSLDITAKSTCAVWAGNGGYYSMLRYSGSSLEQYSAGKMPVGSGGEKNAFWISRAKKQLHSDGKLYKVWHACSDWSYNNSIRSMNNRAPIVWADKNFYPWMGDDGCYPYLVSDSTRPQTSYMFTDYTQYGGPGVCLQIWHGKGTDGGFVFNPQGGLLVVDSKGTSGLRRFAPQMAPAASGAWLCYTRSGNIVITYVPRFARSITDLGPTVTFPGIRGAICVDKRGWLQVVYNNNGPKFRRIKIAYTSY